MTKREVAFFRERRRNPAADIVRALRDLGYTDEQIKDQLLKIQSGRDAQSSAQVASDAKKEENS